MRTNQAATPRHAMLTRARRRLFASSLVAFGALASFAVAPALAAPPAATCTDPSGVCVEGAKFKADSGLTDKSRRKEAKRYKKKKSLELSVAVTEGRASVFVDAVWVGTAPIENFEIKPGKHDLEVRDGNTVMATGLLTISSKHKGPVRVTVRGNPPPPPPPGGAL